MQNNDSKSQLGERDNLEDSNVTSENRRLSHDMEVMLDRFNPQPNIDAQEPA